MYNKSMIAVLAVLLCLANLGCLIVSTGGSKVKIVRANEARKTVTFETDAAAEAFNKGYQQALGRSTLSTEDSGTLVIPFICCVTDNSTTTKLAPNAVYNDCVAGCDSNQDGTITESEARQMATR